MLLEKVYNDFISHTGLDDGVYKTVFIRISDVLDQIKDLKWISLQYNIGANTFNIDFYKQKEIPFFVVEIIENLFNDYFTFPDNSTIKLDIEYKGREYSIISKDNIKTIPEDLKFMVEKSFFNYFLVVHPVHDIFNEYDRLFSFVGEYKTKISSIFTPLNAEFKKQNIKEDIDSGVLSKNEISNDKVVIEKLKSKRDELLDILKVISAEKEVLTKDLHHVRVYTEKLTSSVTEKNILKAEFDSLKKDHEKNIKQFDIFLDVISEIDAALAGLNDSARQQGTPVSQDDLDYLIKKKSNFEEDKERVAEFSKNTKALLDITQLRLQETNNRVTECNDYNEGDIVVLESKVQVKEKEYEDTYIELLSVETAIKQSSVATANQSADLEKIGTDLDPDYSNFSVIEICKHLSDTLQPNSVTVVINYLRYYFAYHTTQIASHLSEMHKDVDIAMIQALSTRLVLAKCFNVLFNNMFSYVDFADSRVNHINVIEVK